MDHRVNCAGQGCGERDGCRRFRLRLPREGQTAVPSERLIFDWASFDLEKKSGECPVFVKFREK
jgi:hypothetical protein